MTSEHMCCVMLNRPVFFEVSCFWWKKNVLQLWDWRVLKWGWWPHLLLRDSETKALILRIYLISIAWKGPKFIRGIVSGSYRDCVCRAVIVNGCVVLWMTLTPFETLCRLLFGCCSASWSRAGLLCWLLEFWWCILCVRYMYWGYSAGH